MNLFDDPGAVEALRQKGATPGVTPPPNPYFDDEPEAPEPSEEPRAAPADDPWAPSWQANEAEEGEEGLQEAKETPAPPPPTPTPPAQPVLQMDPGQMAQAIAWALQAHQQPAAPAEPEWVDPPEIDVDDEAVLENRQSLKKVLREVQTQTARHVKEQMERRLAPEIEQGRQLARFVYSTIPVQESNARNVARSSLLRGGFATEADVDALLDEGSQYIQGSWEHRLNPQGWMGAAQYARLRRAGGAMPATPPKKAPGAGKGDPGASPRRRSAVSQSPHLAEVARRNGKPLSDERMKEWMEATGHAR